MALALAFEFDRLTGDLALGDDGLATDDGLLGALLLSLYCDRRALPDDRLPSSGAAHAEPGLPDRRGWCGDALAEVEGDRWGSRLWLLSREKQTEQTRLRGEDYTREALAWLLEDGVATGLLVAAEWVRRGFLGIRVRVERPDGWKRDFQFTVAAGGGA